MSAKKRKRSTAEDKLRIVVATTLLDATEYTQSDLAELYRAR